MIYTHGDLGSIVNELSNQITESVETELMSQLNDFISRDLIVIHRGPTILTHNPMTNKVEISTSCSLHLKDKDYIVALEKENKELKEFIAKFKDLTR